MCRSMVDIQSATAEIRQGIKKRKKIEDRRKKPQGKNIMSASATQGGHNYRMKIQWSALLHRATIKKLQGKNIMAPPIT